MSETGPSGKALFDMALPQDQGGHVLAVGEYHDRNDHLTFLQDHLQTLRDQHNVGTIGQEMRQFMNVFLWAHQDGNLPVPRDKAQEYLKDMFECYPDPSYSEHLGRQGDLLLHAQKLGLNVVAYDARGTLAEELDIYSDQVNSIRTFFKKYPQIADELHRDPSLLNAWAELNFKSPAGEEFNDYKKTDILHAYMLTEVKNLLRNPDYAKRFAEMEKINTDGTSAGLSADMLSAIALRNATDADKNAVTVGGADHINGVFDVDDNQGFFAGALKTLGYKMTPVIITSSRDLKNGWMPMNMAGGQQYKYLQKNCISSTDMNLYIFKPDHSEELLHIAKPDSAITEQEGNGTIAKAITEKGNVFACNEHMVNNARDGLLNKTLKEVNDIFVPYLAEHAAFGGSASSPQQQQLASDMRTLPTEIQNGENSYADRIAHAKHAIMGLRAYIAQSSANDADSMSVSQNLNILLQKLKLMELDLPANAPLLIKGGINSPFSPVVPTATLQLPASQKELPSH